MITTAVPRDCARIPRSVELPQMREAVGIVRLATANSKNIPMVCATCLLNFCSFQRQPPSREAKPAISSKGCRMPPSKGDRRTPTWRLFKRKMDEISCTALLASRQLTSR